MQQSTTMQQEKIPIGNGAKALYALLTQPTAVSLFKFPISKTDVSLLSYLSLDLWTWKRGTWKGVEVLLI
jgi:hypothetical protein